MCVLEVHIGLLVGVGGVGGQGLAAADNVSVLLDVTRLLLLAPPAAAAADRRRTVKAQ